MYIEWSYSAFSHLENAIEYIAKDNREVAHRLSESVKLKLKQLEQFPHISPANDKGFRSTLIKDFPYILIYHTLKKDMIYIVAFYHTSQNKPKKWIH